MKKNTSILYKGFLAIIFVSAFLFSASVSAQKEPSKIPVADSARSFKNPEFPGGHAAFTQEVLRYFRTSVPASLNIKRAEAIATFIVDTDGVMKQFAIESSQNDVVKEEFLRALKKINKKWTPAEKNGVPVRAVMRQPLVFLLN
ncbi:TonB protein C-terminal [Chryseobacterium ureilyticum]|uniref:TonB protein C-terminal n=1 Tax=Chryseobacterium ureilyticum TaxID=373668 RepID=A0A1N7N3X2_9FLAO|nr:energy transducer TonB [Chryseobacterium ureilyticum]SIS93055.1 TonB protein C-terminal [Chryseobacterium ureilyticum]